MGFESLRETESIAFFRDNKIATPARVTSFNNVGGVTQPTVKINYMQDTGIGKKNDQRDPDKSAYNTGSYNLS